MEGEELHGIYFDVCDARCVEVKTWDELTDNERQLWEDFATDVKERLR